MDLHFPIDPRDDFILKKSRRHIKVLRGKLLYCIVDRITGDVLVPTGKSRTNKSLGNIFDTDNGLRNLGPYGVK